MPRLDLPAIVETLGNRVESGLVDLDDDRFARMVPIILAVVAPNARSRLISRLFDAGLLDLETLATSSLDDVSGLVPGSPESVRKRLKVLGRFARWLLDLGGLEALDGLSTPALRDGLLGISGLGPATVDELLLFGLDRPTYPIDRATYRVFVRHGWLDGSTDPDEARDLIVSAAEGDPSLLRKLSVGLDELGRSTCRVAAPLCDRCPLAPWLPDAGPLGSEA